MAACGHGLWSLSYQAVQAMVMAEEFIWGDRKDPNNIFRWDSVEFNLPGFDDYDPSMPWVYKAITKRKLGLLGDKLLVGQIIWEYRMPLESAAMARPHLARGRDPLSGLGKMEFFC
eukprot:scaffold47333_cov42-Attheya_sp.AAC.2